MRTAITLFLASSLVVAATASAALPYAISATATGNSLGDALFNAQQQAQAHCAAAGLGAAGNLQVTDSRPLGMQWQVTVAGNCGGRLAIRP